MRISNDISIAVSRSHFDIDTGMGARVDEIFKETKQWWHFIPNLLTLGRFNSNRKAQIRAALRGETNEVLAPIDLQKAKAAASVAVPKVFGQQFFLRPEDYRKPWRAERFAG
jgi:hypothetical protein